MPSVEVHDEAVNGRPAQAICFNRWIVVSVILTACEASAQRQIVRERSVPAHGAERCLGLLDLPSALSAAALVHAARTTLISALTIFEGYLSSFCFISSRCQRSIWCCETLDLVHSTDVRCCKAHLSP